MKPKHPIRIKRAYDPPAAGDGARFLVDRLSPRGVRKERLQLTGWCREAAPSAPLRNWFGHEPVKWETFKKRYFTELRQKPQSWQPLMAALEEGPLTLIYSARDPLHNNAAALREFLEAQLDHEMPPEDEPAPSASRRPPPVR